MDREAVAEVLAAQRFDGGASLGGVVELHVGAAAVPAAAAQAQRDLRSQHENSRPSVRVLSSGEKLRLIGLSSEC